MQSIMDRRSFRVVRAFLLGLALTVVITLGDVPFASGKLDPLWSFGLNQMEVAPAQMGPSATAPEKRQPAFAGRPPAFEGDAEVQARARRLMTLLVIAFLQEEAGH